MSKLKPKIFVGSSSEARTIAQSFCDVLSTEAAVVPWWLSPEFQIMHATLDGLMDACNQYDFGLFILTPDDKLESRGEKGFSARDNVLFELGLFLGKLGTKRVFAVIQDVENKKKKVKIPSDLLGIHLPRFIQGDQHALVASVNAASSSIRATIKREGRVHERIKLVSAWGFDMETLTFSMTLSAVKLEKHRNELNDRTLVVVIQKENDAIGFEHDTKIVAGEPRNLSRFYDGNLVLRTNGSKTLSDVEQEDIIWGYLLLAPKDYDFKHIKTISEMINQGCELLERKGAKARKHFEE